MTNSCTLLQETAYPTYILDLMVLCWSQQPRDRPSASQIVSIASAPEFTHLYDIVSLNHSAPVTATVAAAFAHSGQSVYHFLKASSFQMTLLKTIFFFYLIVKHCLNY